jgi:medium-chain acyl-[acyl-carrier-protein] hydrolase
MSSHVSIWKDQRTIESHEIDVNGKLRAHILFAFLLNSAWNHAKQHLFDYQTLSARNLMWVLSKLQLAVVRLPKWGDRIVIETWGKRIERFYALRDFVVSTDDGERLASATSAWMILNKSSYRPQKIEELMKDFPWRNDRSEIETSLKKVQELTNEKGCGEFRVTFSDIDVNSHVTAARYLHWILDSFPPAVLTEKEVQSAEISFIAEAVLDDRVSVSMESSSNQDLCSVRRINDNQELCRARLQWRPSGDGSL